MADRGDDRLLLGEWACLGVLHQGPSHGFAIASRLRPDGDVGRVWALSRPLTYRALEQLTSRELIHPIREEPGLAGGKRTILATTRRGRGRFRTWASTPVEHLRDLRSELLLKLVLSEQSGIGTQALLAGQREMAVALSAALRAEVLAAPDDLVLRWRSESAAAAVRFIDSG